MNSVFRIGVLEWEGLAASLGSAGSTPEHGPWMPRAFGAGVISAPDVVSVLVGGLGARRPDHYDRSVSRAHDAPVKSL